MTVRELIEILREYPEDLEVVHLDAEWGFGTPTIEACDIHAYCPGKTWLVIDGKV